MTWKTYACEISNRPAFVMVDDRFTDKAPVPELPYLAWFGIYCNRPAGGGLWDPQETDRLNTIGEDLLRLCETFGHGWIVYTLHIDTPGVQEYYLYHSDASELDKVFLALKAVHPDYRIEFDRLNDPDWTQYKKYIFSEPTLLPEDP